MTAVASFVAGVKQDLPTIVAQILYHEEIVSISTPMRNSTVLKSQQVEAWKKKIEKGKYPAHQHEHVQAALFAWQYNLLAWYCALVFKILTVRWQSLSRRCRLILLGRAHLSPIFEADAQMGVTG